MRTRAHALRCAPLIATVVFASTAAAQPEADVAYPDDVPGLLRAARAAIDGFEYEAALRFAGRVMAHEPSLDEELAARMLVVEAHASFGRQTDAAAAARELYERDPGHALPAEHLLSPRIRNIFREARDEVAARPPAELSVEVAAEGEEVRFAMTPEEGPSVERVTVSVSTGHDWSDVEAERAGAGWQATVPIAEEIRYAAEALAPSGFVVGRAGSRDDPSIWIGELPSAPPAAEPEPSTDATWWIVGSVAAAAVVAGVVAVLFATEPWVDDPTLDDRVVVPGNSTP